MSFRIHLPKGAGIMSNKNFTWKEMKEYINSEMDIAVMLDTIFEEKLYHEDAPINEYLKSGELEFDFNTKSNYTMVICPFNHGEYSSKNMDSSLYYHDDKGKTKGNQFMCKTGGCASEGSLLTPINLYMRLVKNVPADLLFESNEEYKEAVKELAKMLGVNWSYEKRELSQEEIREFKKQKIRQEVMEIYHNEFRKNNKWARKIREFFFYERGFGQLGFSIRKIIREQKLGYAGGKYGSSFIYNIMKKRKYTDDELLHAGVVQYKKVYNKETGKSTPTNEVIDFLTNRFTIPYQKGNKIDHGYGRRPDFKDELEKMYSKMTEEKIKKHKGGKHLRLGGGVDEPINFQEAKKYESIIIVEGEMDWLTLLALGFNNVVAVGGTNGISKEDIDLLKYHREKSNRRICNEIILCFDEDGPGQAAMNKLGVAFLEEGFDVRVVRLEDGDPNDYLVKKGKEAKAIMSDLIDSSITFEAFVILSIMRQAKLKTNADIRGALIKAKEHLSSINKDELMFIAADIVDEINKKRPENKQIPLEWMLHAWNIIPEPQKSEMIGFENAINKSWVMIVNDKERYNALLENGTLDNLIYVPDVNLFIEKIKKHPHIKNLAFDVKISQEGKESIFRELKDFKFQAFTASTFEEIKKASQSDIIGMFHKIPNPSHKVS